MKQYSKEEIEQAMCGKNNYPFIIEDTAGLGYKDDKYFTTSVRRSIREQASRRVTLEITSYRGVSSGAEHYYGKLIAQGVEFAYIERPTTTTTPWKIIKTNPLFDFIYEFELKRPLTEKEISSGGRYNTERWQGYTLGSYTNAFTDKQEIKDLALACFKARFKGNWELWIDDYTDRYGCHRVNI